MDCPEGLVKLSKHYKILIPCGVADEIIKSPGKERLRALSDQHVVDIVNIDRSKAISIEKEHPQLHRGECEAIALYMKIARLDSCIISDDLQVIHLFQSLNIKRTQKLLKIMKEKRIIDGMTYRSKITKLQKSSFYFYNDAQQ